MSEQTVWIVGESDDYIAAAFSTEAAAREFLDGKTAPIKAKAAEKGYPSDAWEQFSHWWIEEVPLDPEPDA